MKASKAILKKINPHRFETDEKEMKYFILCSDKKRLRKSYRIFKWRGVYFFIHKPYRKNLNHSRYYAVSHLESGYCIIISKTEFGWESNKNGQSKNNYNSFFDDVQRDAIEFLDKRKDEFFDKIKSLKIINNLDSNRANLLAKTTNNKLWLNKGNWYVRLQDGFPLCMNTKNAAERFLHLLQTSKPLDHVENK